MKAKDKCGLPLPLFPNHITRAYKLFTVQHSNDYALLFRNKLKRDNDILVLISCVRLENISLTAGCSEFSKKSLANRRNHKYFIKIKMLDKKQIGKS
jgi:hypothetical protein